MKSSSKKQKLRLKIIRLFSLVFRPQLDKKSVLEQYDLLALTVDEVIDKGYRLYFK